jgi:hypothetical protein
MHGSRARFLVPIVTGLGLLLLALIPAAVGAASPYPPNTVVSTYYDARYCGGPISVVSDSGGNLIDVCTATGVRIDPSAPYGVPGFNYGYLPGSGVGAIPPYATNTGFVPPVYNAGGNAAIIRQYNDGNSNCPNGDVTETLSGFFCTANGQPASSNGFIPAFNGGFVPPYGNGYIPPVYGQTGAGNVIRQYNDGRSNCPNGDVTETVGGFFCTANGQPAFRVG